MTVAVSSGFQSDGQMLTVEIIISIFFLLFAYCFSGFSRLSQHRHLCSVSVPQNLSRRLLLPATSTPAASFKDSQRKTAVVTHRNMKNLYSFTSRLRASFFSVTEAERSASSSVFMFSTKRRRVRATVFKAKRRKCHQWKSKIRLIQRIKLSWQTDQKGFTVSAAHKVSA